MSQPTIGTNGQPSQADMLAFVKALYPGISDQDAMTKAVQLAAQGQQSGTQDRPLYWGGYGGQLTGFPGAAQQRIGHQTEHGGGGYLGQSGYVAYTGGGAGQADTRTPNLRNESDALLWMQQGLFTGNKQALAVRQKMIDAGMVSASGGFDEVLSAWGKLVGMSADAYNSKNKVLESPFELLDAWAKMVQSDQNTSEPFTQTSTTTTVRNPKDLQAAYQNVSQQALGRRATPAEAAAAAGAVPATTSTSSTTGMYDARGRLKTSHTTTREGLGADAINEQFLQEAMASPEYGAYQAAAHYFPALLAAIGAVNSAGAP